MIGVDCFFDTVTADVIVLALREDVSRRVRQERFAAHG